MNTPSIQAVIFDWAGTVIDFGSFAPTSIFVEAMRREFDFEITLEEARKPMGLAKWDHIQALGNLPEVRDRWVSKFGQRMQKNDIDRIYNAFMPLQKEKVIDHAEPILNAVEVINDLKAKGIKIGSCTGYPREVMDVLIPVAANNGFKPDYIVACDDLSQGSRPAPFMALKNVIELGVTDVRRCIKVDDSVPGIEEGHNAGMWTVGLLLSGNEAGLTLEDYLKASETTLEQARNKARTTFEKAQPHFLIDTINDLPAVVEEVELRLQKGERP